MHTKFSDRIDFILSGRDLSSWVKGLGIPGARNQIPKGKIPASAGLLAIKKAENVSLNWLVDGRGDAFMTYKSQTDEELSERLSEYLAEDFTVYLVGDEMRNALVLTMPGQYQVKEHIIDYRIVEVLTGPVGPMTVATIKNNPNRTLHSGSILPESMDAIIAGHVGTYKLFESEDAILNKIGFDKLLMSRIAETSGNYSPHLIPGSHDELLVNTVLGLTKKKKKALLQFLAAG